MFKRADISRVHGGPRNPSRACLQARLGRAVADERGETITEVLVAFVIVGFALLVLAVVIASSSNIVRNSRESMEDFYNTGNQLSAFASEGEDAVAIAQATVTLQGAGGSIALSPEDGAVVPVTAYVGTDAGDVVVSYQEGSSL